MALHPEILADLEVLRTELRKYGSQHRALLELTPIRPAWDWMVDGLLVLVSVQLVVASGGWLTPVALVVIGNRQRALGNILHDAAHRNLCRDRRWNDLATRVFIAPLVFVSLTAYRSDHFRHHLGLGHADSDPDLLVPPALPPHHWSSNYLCYLMTASTWRSAVAGHLVAANAPWRSRCWIVVWWAGLLGLIWITAGTVFTLVFAALWMLARATVFHAITTFREMCDHFGLAAGGVLSKTRDMTGHGFWSLAIHPRHNGYHLTHHLLPAVPYYRLPRAQRLFRQMPSYRDRGRVCGAYFNGLSAVTAAWQAASTR